MKKERKINTVKTQAFSMERIKCHPERSEGSLEKILHCVQNDMNFHYYLYLEHSERNVG